MLTIDASVIWCDVVSFPPKTCQSQISHSILRITVQFSSISVPLFLHDIWSYNNQHIVLELYIIDLHYVQVDYYVL